MVAAGECSESTKRESGEIGRRTRLRIWRGDPWGFESPLSHHLFYLSSSAFKINGRMWRKVPATPLKMNIEQRRVVVTGVGLVSPVGVGTDVTWQALLRGESGIGPITLFDATGFSCRIAGEVKNFVPEDFIERKEIKKMGRFIQFALAASEFAVAQAGLDITKEDSGKVGVYVGSGIGAFEVIEREHSKLLSAGPNRVSPFFITATIANLA